MVPTIYMFINCSTGHLPTPTRGLQGPLPTALKNRYVKNRRPGAGLCVAPEGRTPSHAQVLIHWSAVFDQPRGTQEILEDEGGVTRRTECCVRPAQR